jgi:polyisoprenoid-binding protein YceI
MQKSISCIVFFLLISVGMKAQFLPSSHYYFIDGGHSELRFAIDYMAFGKVSGAFNGVKGLVYYDSLHPSQLSVSLKLEASTLNTGNEGRDKDLVKNWFEADKFPAISYESTDLVQTGNQYLLRGRLTIKGITKNVDLALTRMRGAIPDIRNDEFVVFEGNAELSRKDFGVTMSNWDGERNGMTAISDLVRITFTVLGKQLKEKNYSGRFTNASTQSGLMYQTIKDAPTPEIAANRADSLVKAQAITGDIAFITVGNYLLLLKNVPMAKALLEKGQMIYGSSIGIKEAMIELYLARNDKQSLQAILNDILASDPVNPVALEYRKHVK